MTTRQEQFALSYIKTGNATEAAKEAGYSLQTAYSQGQRLLKKAEVQQFIQELREQNNSQKIADAREMQEILTSIIRKVMDEEVIVVEGAGEGYSVARKVRKEPSLNDVVKAINTLGKMQGLFLEKMQVTGNLPVVIDGGESLED